MFFAYNKKHNLRFVMNTCDKSFDTYYENKTKYKDILEENENLPFNNRNLNLQNEKKHESDESYNEFLKCIKIKNLEQILYYYKIHFDNINININTSTFIQNLHKNNYYNKNEYRRDALLFIDHYNNFMKIDKDSTSYGGSRKKLYNEFLNFLNNNDIFKKENNNIDFFINSFTNSFTNYSNDQILVMINDYYLAFFFFKSFLEVYDIFNEKKGNFLLPGELKTKHNLILVKGYNADEKIKKNNLEQKINEIITVIKKEVIKNINRYLLTPYNERQFLIKPIEPVLTTTTNYRLSDTSSGGSKNLRHSIDLIIQLFKKQRPSLNINPDLLYNCILSSSNKNKNKSLRKYNNQRTKK